MSGDDRYVADYLHQEAFSKVDPVMQDFLRRTAVLERLNGPLCDAVLGESAGQHLLEALEASNSFLVPLDRRREWYRYHPLFRDFLLGELRRTDPQLVETLHVRAADWFLANGSPAMAVDHLLSTTERDRGAQVVADLVPVTYGAGQISTVQRWMTALGDSAISAYRPGRAGRLGHRPGRRDGRCPTVGGDRRRGVVDGSPPGGPASFDSSRSMLRHECATGPSR